MLQDERGPVRATRPKHSPRESLQRCAAIAAASIAAKVTRDRYMCILHKQDSRYGFDKNKGYGTAAHIEAIRQFGYSSAHRRSFRPKALSDTILEGL